MKKAQILDVIVAELSRPNAVSGGKPPYVAAADPQRTVLQGSFNIEALARALQDRHFESLASRTDPRAGAGTGFFLD